MNLSRSLKLTLGAIAAVGLISTAQASSFSISTDIGPPQIIPIPPLDGSWLLMRFLRLKHIVALHHLRSLGFALLMMLMVLPGPSRLLFQTPMHFLVGACYRLYGLPAAP